MTTKTKCLAPLHIESDNLSYAWASIVRHILDNPGTEISPLVVSLYGFSENGEVSEFSRTRSALDALCQSQEKVDVETVAFTIFPQRYWEIADKDRGALFSLYRESYPRISAMNKPANGRGLYFQRMVMFGSGPCDGNQLEWIISQYHSRKGVRKSMFQASIFDPSRDHVGSAQLGFPCLQNVSFEPTDKGLVLNAFYATQQIFDKAYGNYLGLVRLGHFIATEFGLPLARVNVFIGVAKLERIAKRHEGLLRVLETVPSNTPLGDASKLHAAE